MWSRAEEEQRARAGGVLSLRRNHKEIREALADAYVDAYAGKILIMYWSR